MSGLMGGTHTVLKYGALLGGIAIAGYYGVQWYSAYSQNQQQQQQAAAAQAQTDQLNQDALLGSLMQDSSGTYTENSTPPPSGVTSITGTGSTSTSDTSTSGAGNTSTSGQTLSQLIQSLVSQTSSQGSSTSTSPQGSSTSSNTIASDTQFGSDAVTQFNAQLAQVNASLSQANAPATGAYVAPTSGQNAL